MSGRRTPARGPSPQLHRPRPYDVRAVRYRHIVGTGVGWTWGGAPRGRPSPSPCIWHNVIFPGVAWWGPSRASVPFTRQVFFLYYRCCPSRVPRWILRLPRPLTYSTTVIHRPCENTYNYSFLRHSMLSCGKGGKDNGTAY